MLILGVSKCGKPVGIAPTILTPLASRSKKFTARIPSTTTINMDGILALQRFRPMIIKIPLRPIAKS